MNHGHCIPIPISIPNPNLDRKPAHSPENNNIPSPQPLDGIPHPHRQDVPVGSFIHIGVEEWIHTPPGDPHELEDMRMKAPDDG